MAMLNFGGTEEKVVLREEFPLEKARETLKDETIAVIGYGVQGPGQSMNLRDNGFNVIIGQRKGGASWDKAVADGWVPGETLFPIEEAAERGTIIQYLLSDAAQIEVWPTLKKYLSPGKALYFSHGFGITYNERTGIIAPEGVDVILVAPKGSGTSLRRMFLAGRGLNSSYAIAQDATGRAYERVIALGIGVGSGYLFETDFQREVYSDLTGERGTLMGCTVWTGCTPTAPPPPSAERWTGKTSSAMLPAPSSKNSTRASPPAKKHNAASTLTARTTTACCRLQVAGCRL